MFKSFSFSTKKRKRKQIRFYVKKRKKKQLISCDCFKVLVLVQKIYKKKDFIRLRKVHEIKQEFPKMGEKRR